MQLEFVRLIDHDSTKGLRYPIVIPHEKGFTLLGSKVYRTEGTISKYLTSRIRLDANYEFIDESLIDWPGVREDYKTDIHISTWFRSYSPHPDLGYTCIVELKCNIDNTRFEHSNYLFATKDFLTFSMVEEFNGLRDFVFFQEGDVLFSSKIEMGSDPQDKYNNWGRYLFKFIDVTTGATFSPTFDSQVNFKSDAGHVAHNCKKVEKEWILFFSVRVQRNDMPGEYQYKVFTARTQDLRDFWETKEIDVIGESPSQFYTYPNWFTHNNMHFVVTNGHDFGKSSSPYLFRVTKLYSLV